MRTLLRGSRSRYTKRIGLLLIVAALIAVLTGCPIPDPGPSLDLEIRTWYDLDAVRDNLAGYHRLMNDLDATTDGYEALASPTANEGNGWEPIGTWLLDDPHRYRAFTGTFDGQGYEIRDLSIDRPSLSLVGLFGYVHDGTIESLGVVNAAVTGYNYVGSVVGQNHQGTVSNSYFSGYVRAEGIGGGLVGSSGGNVIRCHTSGNVTGGQAVGGLVGFNSGTVDGTHSTGNANGQWGVGGLVGTNEGAVANSFSAGKVTGTREVGGLVGQNGGTVGNSHSAATVIGEDQVGGLVGVNYYDAFYAPGPGTISECYAIGEVSGLSLVGGLVGNNPGTVSASLWDVETSGQAISDGGTGKTTAEMQSFATFTDTETEGLDKPWNMTTVSAGETDPAYTWNIVDGQTYPFLSRKQPVELLEIRTWHDLHAVRDNLSGHYVLMNDLDATTAGYEELAGPTADQGKGWEPIGSGDCDDQGCLGEMFEGTFHGQGYEIRGLTIYRPEELVVGLFGAIGQGGFVKNLGVAGVNVTGAGQVASLAGINKGTVSGSYSSGSVVGDFLVGGLVGANILGGAVADSHSVVSVTGLDAVGGLVGENRWDSEVSHSHFGGSVTGRSFVGGLMGGNSFGSTVSRSYSTGTVVGRDHVGGLVGISMFGAVHDCHSTSSVSGDLYFVGGLVGHNGQWWYAGEPFVYTDSSGVSSHQDCWLNVSWDWGLAGAAWQSLASTVNSCYATGGVTGKESVGGLVGANGYGGSVTDSYFTGNVTGERLIGGLVGGNNGTVANCYASGRVSGSELVGGLVGFVSGGAVSNSFWDAETSGMDVSDGGTGKTTAQMQSIATFTDTATEGLDEAWDIIAVASGKTDAGYTWNIVDGQSYPFLGWQSVQNRA